MVNTYDLSFRSIVFPLSLDDKGEAELVYSAGSPQNDLPLIVGLHGLGSSLHEGFLVDAAPYICSELHLELLKISFFAHRLNRSHERQEDFSISQMTKDVIEILLIPEIKEKIDHQGVIILASSFGAMAALSLASKIENVEQFKIRKLVLRAPMIDGGRSLLIDANGNVHSEIQQMLESQGYIPFKLRNEKIFKIGKKLIEECETLSPEALWNAVKVPTVIFHGDADEVASIERSREAVNHIPIAHLYELPGIGHNISIMDLESAGKLKIFAHALLNSP